MTPISNAAKAAIAATFQPIIDSGAGAGYMTICEGTTVLLTLDFSDPCAASVVGISASVNAILDAVAVATGTADNAKFYDSNDVHHYTGTVGISGTPDVLMQTLSVTLGETIGVSTGVVIYG